jgi:hypothetical protein
MLGDAIAGDPGAPKAFHDVQILGSDDHFTNRLVGTDDHGNAAISKQMGDQVTAIANSYLDAVHGAAISYSGKVMVGYNAGALPDTYLAGWFPNGTEVVPHFNQATDAIQQGVRELLMQTQVIGGDLLIKRAHQAFINGPHPANRRSRRNRGKFRRASRVSLPAFLATERTARNARINPTARIRQHCA